MGKIIIIGMGPGDKDYLTLEAFEKIKNGNNIYLRTAWHGVAEYLTSQQINFYNYDYVYEEKDSFDDVNKFICDDLVQKSQKYGEINYCVPGNPLDGDDTVNMLIDMEADKLVELEIIEGLSTIDLVMNIVKRDLMDGTKILNGLNINGYDMDINLDIIVFQIYNRIIASEFKVMITDVYGDNYNVYVIENTGIKNAHRVHYIPIYQLDRVCSFDHNTVIFIPKMEKENRKVYNMYNLINIMEILRSKDGCPWDMKQTHDSLREYVLEEAYEVVDAIDIGDIDSIVEELGDLLLQVVFHSQIASEEGDFNIKDVTTGICKKLIYRHPHVFGEKKAKGIEDANSNWNDMKAVEKAIKTHTDRMKDIPAGLSSLMKSYKVQKRAADVGFDWDEIADAYDKINEELQEVREEERGGDEQKIEEEIGDLLFAVVNVSRFLHVNPETALNKTVKKFIERFEFIENTALKENKDLNEMSLQEMDKLWNMAKIHKK